MILCPTIKHNKIYQDRKWISEDPEVFILDPGQKLHDYLRAFYKMFQGEPTLYVIDDCSTKAAMTKKKDMLSELAFSWRHALQSVWVCSQRFNSVLKDLREQTRWVALFHCKDRDSFEERLAVRQMLAETKHSKFLTPLSKVLNTLSKVLNTLSKVLNITKQSA